MEALEANEGRATLRDVSKYIWNNYKNELKESGDLFYTWQYDMRWAAVKLRKDGIMQDRFSSPQGIWELTNR